MKELYITLEQAQKLGADLLEYSAMKDSSDREVFKGFKISFGDMLADDVQPDQGFELIPLPEFTEISADKTG